MVMLADVGIYAAILSVKGEAALQAVTTSLNINFLARPQPGDLVGQVRLLKVGRRLAVAEVDILTEDQTESGPAPERQEKMPSGPSCLPAFGRRPERQEQSHLVAHATATYALPPDVVK